MSNEERLYSYRKLKGKIVEIYGSGSEFSKEIGISETALSQKLNCKTSFSQADITKWSELLGITKDEYGSYFFT